MVELAVVTLTAHARLRIQQLKNLRLLARLGDEGEQFLADFRVILVDEPKEELALPRKPLVHVVL